MEAGFNNYGSTSNKNSSPAASLDGSSSTNQETEEETIEREKIIKAIEKMERLAKTGKFPQEKLQEVKQKLKKKYPDISFSTENDDDSQKPENGDDQSQHSFFMRPSEYVNLVHDMQMNALINQQMQVMNAQFNQQCMSSLGISWKPHTHPHSVAYPWQQAMYPNYHTATNYYGHNMYGNPMQMAFHPMMANNNNNHRRPITTNANSASAISFLDNLLDESD